MVTFKDFIPPPSWPFVSVVGKTDDDPDADPLEVICLGIDADGLIHPVVSNPSSPSGLSSVADVARERGARVLGTESEGEEAAGDKGAAPPAGAAPAKIPDFTRGAR